MPCWILPTLQTYFKAHGKTDGPEWSLNDAETTLKKGIGLLTYNKSLPIWQLEMSSPLYTNPIPVIGSQSMIRF